MDQKKLSLLVGAVLILAALASLVMLVMAGKPVTLEVAGSVAGVLAAGCFLIGFQMKPPGGGASVGAIAALVLAMPLLVSCAPGSAPPRLPDAEDVKAVAADVKEDAAKLQAKADELAKKVAEAKAKAVKTAKDTIALVTAARSLAIVAGVLSPKLEEQTGIALGYASDILARYERGEQVAKEELLSAVDAVASVVSTLKQLGRELEPLVDSSLDLVRTAVEGV